MSDANVCSVSLYDFHMNWVERKAREEDFNFSEWVRAKIEEEAQDAPAFIEP